MDTMKNDDKKIISYKDYDEKIGLDLIKEATRLGNPCAFIRVKYNLNDKLFSAWLGNSDNGRYFQPHFLDCYLKYKDARKDFLDNLALTGKINEKIYSCFAWSQLEYKVNPPKEITCEADVKTTMKIEDLNNIIEKLENKKNTSGF